MTTNETTQLWVKAAREKGQRTEHMGDFVFHRNLGERRLLIVCDGQGRSESEQAARILHARLFEAVTEGAKTEKNPVEILRDGLMQADRNIRGIFPPPEGEDIPGISCAVALTVGLHLYVAHVGDCRIYLFRSRKMVFRTKDHTAAQQMVETLEITPGEEATHPLRFEPVRKLGMGTDVQLEVRPQPLALSDGDRVLLCTDGVHDTLEDSRISKFVNGDNPMAAPDKLLETAAITGPADDRAAVVLAVGSEDNGEEVGPVLAAPAARVTAPNHERRSIPDEMADLMRMEQDNLEDPLVPEEAAAPEVEQADQPASAPSTNQDESQQREAPFASDVPTVVDEGEPDAQGKTLQEESEATEEGETRQGASADEVVEEPEYGGDERFEARPGFFARLFKRNAEEEQVSAEFSDDGVSSEYAEGEHEQPKRLLGRFELAVIGILVLLGLVLGAVKLFSGDDKKDDRPVIQGIRKGGQEQAREKKEEVKGSTGSIVGGDSDEFSPENPDPDGKNQPPATDVIVDDDVGGDNGSYPIYGPDKPFGGLDPKEYCMKTLGGSVGECSVFGACGKQLISVRLKLTKFEENPDNLNCSKLLNRGSQVWRVCNQSECKSFGNCAQLWRESHKGLAEECDAVEKKGRLARCKSRFEMVRGLSPDSKFDCEEAQKRLRAVSAVCSEFDSEVSLAAVSQRIENSCQRVACEDAVDDFNRMVEAIERNSSLAQATCKGDRIRNALKTARTACSSDSAMSKKLDDLEEEKKKRCKVEVQPEPDPGKPELGPRERDRKWKICQRAIDNVVAQAKARRHDRGECLSLAGALDSAAEVYNACKPCPAMKKHTAIMKAQGEIRKICSGKEPRRENCSNGRDDDGDGQVDCDDSDCATKPHCINFPIEVEKRERPTVESPLHPPVTTPTPQPDPGEKTVEPRVPLDGL